MYRAAPSTCQVCGRLGAVLSLKPNGTGLWCQRCAWEADLKDQRRRATGPLERLWLSLAARFATGISRRDAIARLTPISSLREAPFGCVVRVIGSVERPDGTLNAPITHRPCVAYDAAIFEQGDRGGDNGVYKTELSRSQEVVDFHVNDETGVALVQTSRCEVVLAEDTHIQTGTMQELSSPVTAPVKLTRERWNPIFHYRESRIETGALVCIVGTLEPARSPWRADEEKLRAFSAEHPLVISTDPEWLR